MNGTDLQFCIHRVESLREQLRLSVWSAAERAELELDLKVAKGALEYARQNLRDDGFDEDVIDALERQFIAEHMEGPVNP